MCICIATVAVIARCVCVCVRVANAAFIAQTSVACAISSCSKGSSFCSTTMPHNKHHQCLLCSDCPWSTRRTCALCMSKECHSSKPAKLHPTIQSLNMETVQQIPVNLHFLSSSQLACRAGAEAAVRCQQGQGVHGRRGPLHSMPGTPAGLWLLG